MFLVFDTETTGLPMWSAPSSDPSQPHIVQFAAVLLEDDGTERAAINLLVKPEGWTIPPETTAIHGIRHEDASEFGVPERVAVDLFRTLASIPDIICAAHNEGFDWRIMRIAMLRVGIERAAIERLQMVRRVCTMRMADKIMQMPPTERMIAAGYRKSKPPSLSECVQHFFGETHDKAHDAMADVRACARVMFHISRAQKAA